MHSLASLSTGETHQCWIFSNSSRLKFAPTSKIPARNPRLSCCCASFNEGYSIYWKETLTPVSVDVESPTRFRTLRSILLKINSVTEPERTASRETKPTGTSVSFRPTHKQNKAIWRMGTRNCMISILEAKPIHAESKQNRDLQWIPLEFEHIFDEKSVERTTECWTSAGP